MAERCECLEDALHFLLQGQVVNFVTRALCRPESSARAMVQERRRRSPRIGSWLPLSPCEIHLITLRYEAAPEG